MTMNEMRRQYSELRSIARKRVQRLGSGEFSWTQTYRKAFYTFYTQFRPLASMGNVSKSELARTIKNLKSFVENKEMSTRGLQNIRKKSLETLHENGYDFVNKSNWREWTEFMEYWRATHPGQDGSPTRAEMRSYLDNVKNGMSPEEAKREFEKYVDNV